MTALGTPSNAEVPEESQSPPMQGGGEKPLVLGVHRTLLLYPIQAIIRCGAAGGFAVIPVGRRIAGVAGSGRRTGNRFRLRGRPGVPWGADRGPGVPVVRPGRVRLVGRRTGGFAGAVSVG